MICSAGKLLELKAVTFRFALAPLLCGLASCSLLFGEEISSTDDGDGGLLEIDGGREDVCANTTTLPTFGDPLGILRATRLDLDRDGIEDVMLHASSTVGVATSYVHYGRCPRQSVWDYQFAWTPRSTEVGAEDFDVHTAVLAAGEGASDRLVAIGETTSGMRVASFAMQEGAPEATTEFVEPFPEAGGSACLGSKGPFSLVAGNFDEDNGRSANDVAFADGNQAWRYLVGTWDFPTPWDVSCSGGNVSGSFPDQISDAHRRLGVVAVPREAPLTDEFLDVGAGVIAWPAVDASFTYSLADAQGLGVGRVGLDDQHRDFVIWNHASPNIDIGSIGLETVNAGQQRSLTLTLTDLDVGVARPQAATLIQDGGQDYVALVAGPSLYYFSVGSGFTPQVIPLNFDPVDMIAVNWGAAGTDQILLFDGASGIYACFEATGPGVLTSCADTSP